MKTAIGQDSHRFEPEEGKPLILGGVVIPGYPGLLANSDGDVVLHALTNAISGITAVNILGKPADEMCRAGIIKSSAYVAEALKYLKDDEHITHVSFSIECSRPRLAPHIDTMRRSIAALLGIDGSDVGITATSGEGLTDFGRGLGINVFCIVTAEGS